MSLSFLKWDLTLTHWTQVSDRCPMGYLLAHLSRRLTRWAYSIPMVRRPSVVVRLRPFSSIVVVHTFKLEYLWSQLANLDQILCVASLGWGKGCIRFWSRLDQNSGFHGNRNPHWLIMGKTMSPLFLGHFWSDPFYTWASKNIPINL